MTTLEDHNKQNTLLAKSLVIKVADVATVINKDVVNKGHTVLENMKTWKYYQNLAGIRHPTNKDVQITILENSTIGVLSKELLDKYPYTKAELLKNDIFYQNIINRNPAEYDYIQGCLYPVDIEKAIKAKDGSILAYNHDLIEPNEYNLIKEIEQYTQSFISRWHNREYTIIEELYLPAMLGVMYASLPAKILNLRMDKMLTSEVHSFHVEHELRSSLDIYDAVQFLTKETVIWLYKNISNIKKNIGRDGNFELIVKKLLTASNIGVGKYNLYKNNPKKIADRLANQSKFEYAETKILVEHLNEYLTSKGSEKDTITVVTDEMKEFITSDLTELEKTNLANMTTLINQNLTNDVKNTKEFGTKVVEIETYKYFKRHGQDLFKICLDYIIYGIEKNTFRFNITYIDPNTGLSYRITPRGALLMLLKVIMWLTNNKDLKLKSVYYDLVLESDPNCMYEAYKLFLQDEYTNKLFPELMQAYPAVDRLCSSAIDVQSLINSVTNYFVTYWAYDVNSENSMVSCNLKYLMNICTVKGKYKLTDVEEGVDIDTLLKEENITYELQDSYNLWNSLSSIVKIITNIDLDELSTIKEINSAFKTLLRKLIAYTTQILTTDIGENSIYVFYNNKGIHRSNAGIARVDDASIDALERNYVKVTGYANNFFGAGYNNSYQQNNMLVYENTDPWNIKGYVRNIPAKGYDLSYPVTNVQVLNPNVAGDNNFPWEEPILVKDLKGSIKGLETNFVKSVLTTLPGSSKPEAMNVTLPAQITTYPQNTTLPIHGFMYNKTALNTVTIKPTFMANVIDTYAIGADPKVWKEPELLKDVKLHVKALEENFIQTWSGTTGLAPDNAALMRAGLDNYITESKVEELPVPTKPKIVTTGVMIQPATAVEIKE